MLVSFIVSLLLCPNCKPLYWEDFSEIHQKQIITSSKNSEIVYQYACNPWDIKDSQKTFCLLDTLSSLSDDEEIKALYFYEFNKVLISSQKDGALGEAIVDYVHRVIISDPGYVLFFLQNNAVYEEIYLSGLGQYYYFSNNYDLNDIIESLCPNSCISKDWITSFCKKVNDYWLALNED